jgi:hypothetical protein
MLVGFGCCIVPHSTSPTRFLRPSTRVSHFEQRVFPSPKSNAFCSRSQAKLWGYPDLVKSSKEGKRLTELLQPGCHLLPLELSQHLSVQQLIQVAISFIFDNAITTTTDGDGSSSSVEDKQHPSPKCDITCQPVKLQLSPPP